MGEQLPARVDRPRLGGRLLAAAMEDIRLAAHNAGLAADRAEQEGILKRRRYSERPPRHEYFLTEKGLDLWPVMISLLHWGDRHLEWPDGPPVVVVHKGCGGRVTDRRICERCGKHLEVREARAENGPGAPAELRDAA